MLLSLGSLTFGGRKTGLGDNGAALRCCCLPSGGFEGSPRQGLEAGGSSHSCWPPDPSAVHCLPQSDCSKVLHFFLFRVL